MKNRKRLVAILAGFMAFMLLFSLILSLIPVPAHAYASSSEIRAQINALKEEKKAIQAQIQEVKEQYKQNEDEIADVVARKNVIDQEIGLLSTELLNINEIAAQTNSMAHVAVRINPNIDAHTHQYITTGLNENKFGINLENLGEFVSTALSLSNVDLCGLHYHIGSQIRDLEPFEKLCDKVNDTLAYIESLGAQISIIDVGGGLGINYDDPDSEPIADFKTYFEIFARNIKRRPDQQIHFEPGRSIVAQAGSLITRVLYVKEGTAKKFVIVDAGMTDLIRPALYQAHHKIENISSHSSVDDKYDVVGPICESSDCFGTDERLPLTNRGDFLALRSAGAYGEVMASRYNCRHLPGSILSTELD